MVNTDRREESWGLGSFGWTETGIGVEVRAGQKLPWLHKSASQIQGDDPAAARHASRCDLRVRWEQEGPLVEGLGGVVLSELHKPVKSV